MTHSPDPLKAYQRASETTSPARQVVMLFDGCIRQLHLAMEAMPAQDAPQRLQRLRKAGDILLTLQSALPELGTHPVLPVLSAAYHDLHARVLALHRTHDVADCAELLDDLRALRDHFDKLARE